MKRIKIGNKYLIQEDDGCIREETRKEKADYNYLTSSYKEDIERINETQPEKIKRYRNVCEEIDTKHRTKSFYVTKIIMWEETLNFLNENDKVRDSIFMKYGLYTVNIILDSDISFGYIKMYFDDNRIETIEIGDCCKKKQHYFESLMDELKKSKNNYKK